MKIGTLMVQFEIVQQGDDNVAVMQTKAGDAVLKQKSIANFGNRKEDAIAFSKWCFDRYYNTAYGRDRILKWVKKCDPKKKMKLVMISNRAFIEEQ